MVSKEHCLETDDLIHAETVIYTLNTEAELLLDSKTPILNVILHDNNILLYSPKKYRNDTSMKKCVEFKTKDFAIETFLKLVKHTENTSVNLDSPEYYHLFKGNVTINHNTEVSNRIRTYAGLLINKHIGSVAFQGKKGTFLLINKEGAIMGGAVEAQKPSKYFFQSSAKEETNKEVQNTTPYTVTPPSNKVGVFDDSVEQVKYQDLMCPEPYSEQVGIVRRTSDMSGTITVRVLNKRDELVNLVENHKDGVLIVTNLREILIDTSQMEHKDIINSICLSVYKLCATNNNSLLYSTFFDKLSEILSILHPQARKTLYSV